MAAPTDAASTGVGWKCLWERQGPPQKEPAAARAFAPPLKQVSFLTQILRLEFDHAHSEYYTQLDAVEMHGCTVAAFAPSEPGRREDVMRQRMPSSDDEHGIPSDATGARDSPARNTIDAPFDAHASARIGATPPTNVAVVADGNASVLRTVSDNASGRRETARGPRAVEPRPRLGASFSQPATTGGLGYGHAPTRSTRPSNTPSQALEPCGSHVFHPPDHSVWNDGMPAATSDALVCAQTSTATGFLLRRVSSEPSFHAAASRAHARDAVAVASHAPITLDLLPVELVRYHAERDTAVFVARGECMTVAGSVYLSLCESVGLRVYLIAGVCCVRYALWSIDRTVVCCRFSTSWDDWTCVTLPV
eukprot:m.673615 g.673615  ORF g.673615 m.673615 type:complete len:364 (-) comp22783_c0_seq11:3004-4095(-)